MIDPEGQFDLDQYDKLSTQTKKLFRENDINLFYVPWFQCRMLATSDDAAFRSYQKIYKDWEQTQSQATWSQNGKSS